MLLFPVATQHLSQIDLLTVEVCPIMPQRLTGVVKYSGCIAHLALIGRDSEGGWHASVVLISEPR